MCFAAVCAHFWRETVSFSTENRAILHPSRLDFGAHAARIDCKTCAMIVSSVRTSCKINMHHIFERAVRSARKIRKNLHENRTCSHSFFQSFCARQARCEFATHSEVHLNVLKMMYGISAASECGLRLFARIFGAKLRRFRPKIARFRVSRGAILARTTRASTVKRVKSSSAVAGSFAK